tara:strand:+ start:15619 stop:16698 length:1080 start_codon:yes stop_codon:yes gene_type:complete
MDEQFYFQYFPVTIIFAYFAYTLVDTYFYNKYNSMNNDDLYYEINNTMYKVKDEKIIELKPLQCSRTLLNFNNLKEEFIPDTDDETNNKSSDTDDDDIDIIPDTDDDIDIIPDTDDNANEITEIVDEVMNEVIDNQVENNEEIEIVEENPIEYSTFISTNYEEEIKKTNNPFYKNLNITFDVLFEKKEKKEENNVEDNVEDNIESKDFQIITEIVNQFDNWGLENNNDEFYKLIIVGNDFKFIFDNLFKVLNEYYSISSKINIIFNKEQLNNFKKYIFDESVLNNFHTPIFSHRHLNFNLINLYDLYAYINNEKEMLDYEDVNFENVEDLREYYNLEVMNLKNNEVSTNLFGNFFSSFY